MNRMKVMLVALSVMGLVFSSRATTVDGELSEGGTVLTVEVGSGEADFGTGHLSALTGNTVTRFVKTGDGTLTIPANVDLSAYAGEIAVEGGVYRILASTGAGSSSAGDLKVSETAAFEIAPPSGTTIDLGSKHVFFAGEGPDGKGALRCAAASAQDGGRAFGTNLEMTGDAIIAVTTACQLSFGTSSQIWQLDMDGHDLELRPYSGVGGKGAQNIRFMGKTTIANSGNITVKQGNLIIRECPSDMTLAGTSANSLTMGSSDNGATMLQFSKSKLFTPWTLVWNTTRNFDVPSTDLTTTTNQNFWAGPVNLMTDMNVNFGNYNLFQRASFWGKVSGSGGLRLVGAYDAGKAAYTDGELTLLSSENDFSGGVTATHAKLRLAQPGALPPSGGDFIGNDATLTLDGTSAYALPGAAFEGDSAMLGGNGRWTRPVVKTGNGTLTLATAVGGSELDMRGGRGVFSPGRDGRIAGLISGCCVFKTTAEALAAYESGEVITNCVELTPAAAYDTTHAYWTKGNSLITYTGYLWNAAATDATWSFVTAMGRKAKLIVNGATVFENEYVTGDAATTKMTCGHANAIVHPGANRFELRIHTSASLQGPSCRSVQDKPEWIKSKFGFVIDREGRDVAGARDDAYNYYTAIADAGDAQSITWFGAGSDATCVHPETGATIELVPIFDRISFSGGAVLDCASLSAYTTSDLDGFAKVLNCGTFGVTGAWTLDASALTGTLTTAGKLDFTGAALALTNAASVKSGSFVIATAEGGIVAQPTLPDDLVEKGWELSCEDDGKSLHLKKNPSGLILLFR